MRNAIFQGKVAVITGAGSGIGRELARGLAARGAKLALSDIDAEAATETQTLLPAGATPKVYRLDVTNREAVFAHAEEVRRDFGGAHFLFNNAGSGMVGTFEHQTLEEIEWLINLDLWSVIHCSKAFLPTMLAQRQGHIVNLSSIAGLIGLPALNAYNIAKFGVRGFTESLWSELHGTGVSAICVHPGGIRTNIHRASRRCKHAGPLEDRIEAANNKTLVTPPERCATDILNGIARGRRRILTGHRSTTADLIARLFPGRYPALLTSIV